MNLIFNEVVISESAYKHYKYHSIPANNWTYTFSKYVSKHELNFFNIGFVRSRLYPYGTLICKIDHSMLAQDLQQIPLPYINFARLREISQYYFLAKYLSNYSNPILITYNIPKYHNKIIKDTKQAKYRWIPILLDYDNFDKTQNELTSILSHAIGFATVSQFALDHISHKNKILIDGGVDDSLIDLYSNVTINYNDKYILYAGMLNIWGGIEELIDIFNTNDKIDLKLYIVGHGNLTKKIINKNIVFLGRVTDSHLHELCLNAYCFINPRPEDTDGNQMNFPSKIFKYLEYGKPIISTKTLGISNDFDDILIYYNSKSIESLLTAIKKVHNTYENLGLSYYYNKTMGFIKSKRSWSIQSERFITWIKSL